jgi:hypothetical protein
MGPPVPGGPFVRPGFIPTQPMPMPVHTSPGMVPASPSTLVPAMPGSMPPPITLQPQPVTVATPAPAQPQQQRISRRLEIRDPKTGTVVLKGWSGSGSEAPVTSTVTTTSATTTTVTTATASMVATLSAPSFVPASKPAPVDTEPFPDEIESETDEEVAREAEVAKFLSTLAEMRKVAKDVNYKEYPPFLAKFVFVSGEKDGRGSRGHGGGRGGDRDREGDSESKVTFPRPLESEDAPKPFQRVKRELSHDDAVIAKLRSHLGKLSPDTEASLVGKIRDLPVNSIALLERVVELVFDTALSNKFFQDLYAALCKKLGHSDLWVENFVRVGLRRCLQLRKWAVGRF